MRSSALVTSRLGVTVAQSSATLNWVTTGLGQAQATTLLITPCTSTPTSSLHHPCAGAHTPPHPLGGGWRSYGAAAASAASRAARRKSAFDFDPDTPRPARASSASSTFRPTAPSPVPSAPKAAPTTAPQAQAQASPASQVRPTEAQAGPDAGARAVPASPLDFGDHAAVFEGQSTGQLLRAYGVLRACGFKPLVSHAEWLLGTSRRLLGAGATDALVKASFFKHFCAGEDVGEVQRTVDRLRGLGVGAILDYAAEDDVGHANATPAATPNANATPAATPNAGTTATAGTAGSAAATAAAPPPGGAAPGPAGPADQPVVEGPVGPGAPSTAVARALGVVGRTYDYASEEQCDRHVEHFLAAIRMAARQPGRPAFAAIKMTALGNPALLQRASTAIATLHRLFATFDEDGSGFVDRAEFDRQWRRLLLGAGGLGAGAQGGSHGGVGLGPGAEAWVASTAEDTFRWLDTQGNGKVDYVSWCQRVELQRMPGLARLLVEGGGGSEVADACLDDREVELMEALLGRLQVLVSEALALDVSLMIDAEHTYFQPAIEHVTLRLMREHNRDGHARVLNTYQAYLVDCPGRLRRDLERSRREGWVLGAKLVRGAYLHLERHRAAALGLPPPCWPSLEDTHAAYDVCVEALVEAAAEGRAQVLLGSHNQASVERAVAAMARHGLAPSPSASSSSSSSAPSPSVMFGQLLGMADHLTLTLGRAGFKAYKYVPYGRVGQVMPYLLRRAAENSDIMKGSKHDLALLSAELRRRALAGLGLGAGATAAAGAKA
ncbi:hypothetical protein HYH03_002471 [Edaphochlamys debaryana]|uniref:Proline dehydrogenase n=1 Tax=Edaphochlamys debaryana TaxID=47281 RepID=A0A836C462_9CHLO|nr:hypothetical protein HYH03_002471 [Edaphochlamys debaryana]|eukprot:KAG2499525.1 hypothetical protein HYH03_002471 [Edaphochlamys debaryana]